MQSGSGDAYEIERQRLLDDVARMTHETSAETGRTTLDPRVMEALGRVARHRLVPAGDEGQAYRNSPLSIGFGQTISQPFIVALMTDLLELKAGDKVLEVGTGSGYQAAVLAELGARVYTTEIIEELGRAAQERLSALGYDTIVLRIGDGSAGWPEQAPFDAVVVTAAPPAVPRALEDQLKPGGRLVVPVGSAEGDQTLYLIAKDAHGRIERRPVLAVRFVPMTGGCRR
jgi:protein-L-isoaspartate(D-aspartate) O-methyltransferase